MDHPNWQEKLPHMTIGEQMELADRFRPIHEKAPGTLGFSITSSVKTMREMAQEGKSIEEIKNREKSYWRIKVGVGEDYDQSLPEIFEGLPVETYPTRPGIAI